MTTCTVRSVDGDETDEWGDVIVDAPWRPAIDVRAVAARLPRETLSVSDVPWSRFNHCCGSAKGVPDHLDRLHDHDPDRAAKELRWFGDLVCHQNTTSAPGALAVPFLVRISADHSLPHRAQSLVLVGNLARYNFWGFEDRNGLLDVRGSGLYYDPSGYPATWSVTAARYLVDTCADTLLDLLGEDSSALRCAAAYALATGAADRADVTAALQRRLAAETVPSAQVSAVLALAQRAREHGSGAAALQWVSDLCLDRQAPDGVRYGAVIAWLCLTTAPVPAELAHVFHEKIIPDLQDVPWLSYVEQVPGLRTWQARMTA